MSRSRLFPLAIFLLAAPARAAGPNELTLAERQGLIAQITRCVPPINTTGQSMTTIDLRLNPDGSVVAESKVIASPTPEIGKAMLRAAMDSAAMARPIAKRTSHRSEPNSKWRDL